MHLVYDEITGTHTQDISLDVDMDLVYVCPYLIKYGNPSGSVQVVIKDADSNTIATNSVAISSISSSDYFHGFVRFDFERIYLPLGDYTIEFSGISGYSYSSSDHIGLVKEHENHTNNISGDVNVDFENPISIRLWSNTWQRG